MEVMAVAELRPLWARVFARPGEFANVFFAYDGTILGAFEAIALVLKCR